MDPMGLAIWPNIPNGNPPKNKPSTTTICAKKRSAPVFALDLSKITIPRY